jgi:hypothetical protein
MHYYRLVAIISFLLLNSKVGFAQCTKGNCIDGYGVKIYEDSSVFKGEFEKGLRKNGTYIYKNGDKYTGGYSNNLMDGHGIYTYKNGDEFKGEFVDNEKVFGKYYFSSGNVYEGVFLKNKPHGYGVLKEPTGNIVQGEWHNGKLLWNESADTTSALITVSTNETLEEVKGESKGDSYPKFYCVIVGISDYQGTESDLNYADRDAKLFHEHLLKAFPREMAAGKSKLLLNDQATGSNVNMAIEDIFQLAGENDFVLFFFSGHGGPGHFCPYDNVTSSVDHISLKNKFKSSQAKFKICIADACFSGSIGGISGDQTSPLTYYSTVSALNDTRLAVIMSSNSNQTSQETGNLRQGVFSYYLISGLSGLADNNNDSYVTVAELFLYTQNKVYSYSGGKQTPIIFGQNLNRIPLARIKR